jgi:hypothetical protein
MADEGMPAMMNGKYLQSLLTEHFAGHAESLPESVVGEYDSPAGHTKNMSYTC